MTTDELRLKIANKIRAEVEPRLEPYSINEICCEDCGQKILDIAIKIVLEYDGHE